MKTFKRITSSLLICLLITFSIGSSLAFANSNDGTEYVNGNANIEEKNIEKIPSAVVEPMRAQYGVINADGVRLRSTPGLSGTILMLLYKGYEVTVSYDSTVNADGYTWQKVGYNGTVGWVSTNYLTEY